MVVVFFIDISKLGKHEIFCFAFKSVKCRSIVFGEKKHSSEIKMFNYGPVNIAT